MKSADSLDVTDPAIHFLLLCRKRMPTAPDCRPSRNHSQVSFQCCASVTKRKRIQWMPCNPSDFCWPARARTSERRQRQSEDEDPNSVAFSRNIVRTTLEGHTSVPVHWNQLNIQQQSIISNVTCQDNNTAHPPQPPTSCSSTVELAESEKWTNSKKQFRKSPFIR
jgi:hypothetical protein